MDCVYTVYEHYGNYGGFAMGYYERQSIAGGTSEFFPGNVAYIEYRVQPLDDRCGFWCECEVSTLTGEMVALDRWGSRYENECLAKAAVIEKAIEKAQRFKSGVKCKVADLDATDVMQTLIKRGEKERERV